MYTIHLLLNIQNCNVEDMKRFYVENRTGNMLLKIIPPEL